MKISIPLSLSLLGATARSGLIQVRAPLGCGVEKADPVSTNVTPRRFVLLERVEQGRAERRSEYRHQKGERVSLVNRFAAAPWTRQRRALLGE